MRCVGRRGGGEVKEIHGCWNEEAKEAVSRKKDAHKVICQDNTEENKRYKSMKINQRKRFQK